MVNRKDVPQDAEALIEWDKRMDSVYVKGVRHSGFASLSRKELVTMMRTYKARYIVRPRFEEIPRLPLKMIYPPPDQHSFYEVYELSR